MPSTVTRRASIASLTDDRRGRRSGSGTEAGPRTRSRADEAAHLQLAVRVGEAAGHLDARAARRPRVQVADPDDDRRRRVLDREQRGRPEPPGFGRDDAAHRHAAADRRRLRASAIVVVVGAGLGLAAGARARCGRWRRVSASGSGSATAMATALGSGDGLAGVGSRARQWRRHRARQRRRRRQRRVDDELAGQRGVQAIAARPRFRCCPAGPAVRPRWTTSPVCDRSRRPARPSTPRSGADRFRRRS